MTETELRARVQGSILISEETKKLLLEKSWPEKTQQEIEKFFELYGPKEREITRFLTENLGGVMITTIHTIEQNERASHDIPELQKMEEQFIRL